MKYYENMNQYETSHLKHSSNISFVKRLIAEIKFNGHRVSPKCLIEGINAFAGPLRPLMLSVCDGLNCFFEGKKLLQQLSPHYLIMPLTLLQLSVQLILRFPLSWMELECSLKPSFKNYQFFTYCSSFAKYNLQGGNFLQNWLETRSTLDVLANTTSPELLRWENISQPSITRRTLQGISV